MSRTLRCLAMLAVAVTVARPGPASAQATAPAVTGFARTGTDLRTAMFSAACSQSARNADGVLSVTLALPQQKSLAPVFDFAAVENPYPSDVTKATLVVDARPSVSLATNGTLTGNGGFEFAAAAMMRGDAANLARLAAMLRPLTEGPATVLWTQGNPRRGGPPIEASFVLAQADSDRLRPALTPCLGASPPAVAQAVRPQASTWRSTDRFSKITLTLRPTGERRATIAIDGSSGECMMSVTGAATEQAPGRWLLTAGTDRDLCRIKLEQRGDNQLVVTDESDSCMEFHGVRCNFLGSLARVRGRN